MKPVNFEEIEACTTTSPSNPMKKNSSNTSSFISTSRRTLTYEILFLFAVMQPVLSGYPTLLTSLSIAFGLQNRKSKSGNQILIRLRSSTSFSILNREIHSRSTGDLSFENQEFPIIHIVSLLSAKRKI